MFSTRTSTCLPNQGDGSQLINISPNTLGNRPLGTHDDQGYAQNPVTNQPYADQFVKRADYGRVLAEFWADGPDSETPPGHWNVIANEVSDHPALVKMLGGSGPVVDDLRWDTQLYLVLNGALHDAAEVLSLFTGSEYFPGGLGEMNFAMNGFLDFEQGPSGQVTLQWPKYYDAADEAGISRLWGGIHVPPDDFAGRIMGAQIGIEAFGHADNYFRAVPEPTSLTLAAIALAALLHLVSRRRRFCT